ncbi:UxaA family hydrolase [Agaribacter flavus]|uniref:UxaA family hydrolase n=1 Tax=Agaribacter flavus TaxID=1902781 RepID=A0ABV7FML5_9ALTE
MQENSSTTRKALRVHHDDNVAVAITSLSKNSEIENPADTQNTLALKQDIPAGHKIALSPINKGDHIYKYGFSIGLATSDICVGEHVHSHNLSTQLNGSETYSFKKTDSDRTIKNPCPTFSGYLRETGKVGIRNEVWIVNTVGCVNQAARKIADICKKQYPNKADDYIAQTHPFGCSQLGDDLNNTRKVLQSLVQNPNAGGVLIIGLGCENNQLSTFVSGLPKTQRKRVRYFNSQQVEDEIVTGLQHIEALLDLMAHDKRELVPVSELSIGMKCGGSDGFSGLTANAIVGRVSDKLTEYGGRVILTETPEMFGAEQVLMNRSASEAVYNEIVHLVEDFKSYFIKNNQPIYENPSPGNKAGGLTTLEEKSLGAIQKGGQAVVNEVIAYGERSQGGAGLSLLQAPGNDAVSSTALAAAGANMILFTTGRGTPLGFPVPTVKIASNSDLASRKKHWIDFNAGVILDEEKSIDACADELFSYILDVASGRLTRNEENDNREIAIWKSGVTL